MFPDSLSRSAQLHAPFEALLHLSDSNFHFSEHKKKRGGDLICVSSRAHWERRSRLGLPFQLGGVAPVISGPSKVSLQTLHFLLRWKPRWADNEESAFPVTEDALCSAWEQTLGPSPSPTSACLARPALFAVTPHQSRKNERSTWERNNCPQYKILPNRLHPNLNPSPFPPLIIPSSLLLFSPTPLTSLSPSTESDLIVFTESSASPDVC